jgi:hypothetical protein
VTRFSFIREPSKALVLLAIASSTISAAQRRDPAPEDVLASARKALAGGQTDSVKSLRLHGRSQSLNLATAQAAEPRQLEIRILLPDHFLRIERTDAIEWRYGFSGDVLLNAMKPLKPDVNVGGSWGPEQLKIERLTAARLVLGMLARADVLAGVRPIASDASATTIEGPDGFKAMLELDPSTRIPLRLRYQSGVRLPPPGGQPLGGPPPSTQAEVIQEFLERRAVVGVLIPHRVMTTAKGFTLSDLRFDKIVVNPGFRPGDFTK